tara:strand:- start:1768 stop:2154 length:387 start_codon:yes stop_codon:yes gene_type:complete
MRKITKEAVKAFYNNYNYSKDNTQVRHSGTGSLYTSFFYLHNNLIATKQKDELIISNCGWFSNTTKERLNGILNYIGNVGIYQKRFQWFLNGEKWNGQRTKIKISNGRVKLIESQKIKSNGFEYYNIV